MADNEEETTVDETADEEVETTDEANPDVESAKGFADDVASKVALVESGEMTLSEFVEGCTATLQAIETPEADTLGGLGEDEGSFFDIDSEDREETA